MKRLMIKTVLAAAALAVLGVASAQDIKERTLKLGLQNPKGHPLEQGATRFAEIVAAKSGGKLKVNVFPGGVLGGDAATVSALQGGTVEITVLNSGILASQVKDFEVYDFPFMFASAREADAVVDGPFGQKLHAKLADKAIVGLAYWELGFRNMSNSRRLIGAGIQRSLTPAMQRSRGRRPGLAPALPADRPGPAASGVDALPGLIQAAKVMGFAGLNITYPCKQAVMPLLDGLSDEARAMGAVNTVVFAVARPSATTPTAAAGLGLHPRAAAGRPVRVVLLGAGGAGSAIAHAVLRLGAGSWRWWTPTPPAPVRWPTA
jgi:hypothetical protein